MAISSHNSYIFSLKVLLTSTAIFSIAIILKLSIPVVIQFIISELPLIWSSFLSWLRPPYLYVVINGIIITIAASSRFHHQKDKEDHTDVESLVKVTSPTAPVSSPFVISNDYDNDSVVVLKSPMEARSGYERVADYGVDTSSVMPHPIEKKLENEFVISRSSWTPSRRDSTEIPKESSFPVEKPPVSVRFSHRRTIRSSPEAGKALGVAKPKRHDTLESTWKTITDGRPIPLARHLKKSDTWETHGRHHHHTAGPQEQKPDSPKMIKSETFKDRSANTEVGSPGVGKLKKEPSLSQDELNRRVEAFINKFNEEMRLQRQKSLNQYKQMVNRR